MTTEQQWEVEVGDKRYLTDLETIRLWVREGRIRSTDRVRKGDLDWARIALVPQLRGITPDEEMISNLAVQRTRMEIPKLPTGDRPCEVCAEEIRSAALKCRYCGAPSIQPEWKGFSRKYSACDEPLRNTYWTAMETPEREYFTRVLDFGKLESSFPQNTSSQNLDYSESIAYFYHTDGIPRKGFVFARNEEHARELVMAGLSAEASITSVTRMPVGRFSCPRCGNRYATSQRDISCAIVVVIFVSFGLGLIMIPFLPHVCSCSACQHRWKA